MQDTTRYTTSTSLHAAILSAAVTAWDKAENPDVPYGHITFRHASGSIKLLNTKERLQQFASQMMRTKSTWALWGGGPMPAVQAKKRKTWQGSAVALCKTLFSDKDIAGTWDIAQNKLGGQVYDCGRGAFAIVAPESIEGLPEQFKSGWNLDAKRWVVYCKVTGYALGGVDARARTREQCEEWAKLTWSKATEETRSRAYPTKIIGTQRDHVGAWFAQHGATQPTPTPDDAEAQALAVDAVAPVADVAPVAPVADVVADAPIKTILGSPWQKATGTRDEWNAIEHKNATPLGFYADLMACIKQAQSSGLFYNSDVYPKAAELMAAMGYEDAREATAEHSVNSVFGSHCYLAGSAIRTLAKQQADVNNLARLAPFVGQELGTLVFIDYKRTTNVTITELNSDGLIKFSGKRGAQKVHGQADATALFNAINRAHERKQRKDNADTFKAHTPSNAADAVAEVVADAVAAVAIDAAQVTARGAELAAVADVASTGQDVATPAAEAQAAADACTDADADTCTADAVADATEAQASTATGTATPGHTTAPRAMASTAGAQPGTPGSTGTARTTGTAGAQPGQAGGRGQLVAGKSGRWVATFHTTAAGLPGMLYTGPDGVASAHEFDTGSARMAALQRLARAADATQPATPATPTETAADAPTHGKAAATPHTPPPSAADGQATPPVCAAGAPNYTDPLKTLGIDYTQPLKTLAVPPATPTDWQALVGAGVTYTGDACNAPGNGAIVAVHETPCGRAAWLTVDVMLEDGRYPKALRLNAFGDKPGDRYRLRPMLHGAPYLAQLAAAVAMREANRTATKAMADKAHADATARLAVEFAHLERAENTHGGGTFAARNIRTALKRAFPGVKFSVTSDYSSVRVKWTDGPTDAQVNDVIGRFSTGASDTQSDYFYTVETAFSKLFGGVQYLFTDRNTSEAFTADVLAAWWPTRCESATHLAPSAQDWKRSEGLFNWRTGCDHLRDAFRKHLRETAGPAPTPTKATRKAKA